MRKGRKMLLVMAGTTSAALLLGVITWVVANSRDIAPADTSDLVWEVIDVPDRDNGYTYFRKAYDALQWPKDEYKVMSMLLGNTWDDAYVADLIGRNAQTLVLLKQGVACAAYQPQDIREPNEPKLIWSSKTQRFMALQAAYERRRGQKVEAWGASCDLLRFGTLIMTRPSAFSDHLAGMIASTRGLRELQQLLAEWSPGEARLVELLNRLNSVEPLDRGYVRAVKGQFGLFADGINRLRPAAASRFWLGRYLFHPNRTTATGAEFYRAVIRNLAQPYAQAHLEKPARCELEGVQRHVLLLRRNSQGRLLVMDSLLDADWANGIMAEKCMMQSHLDGLRLVVACRLYEMRHGRLPETLEALAPELIDRVPADPFDGKPFRYAREDAVVYSVGRDLQDSWASGEPAPDVLLFPRAPRNTDDLVYYIHAQAE